MGFCAIILLGLNGVCLNLLGICMSVCILINSTPAYYFMLELQVLMIRRYANKLTWPIYFATEVPEHEICVKLRGLGVRILELPSEHAGFLESRAYALDRLPFQFVLPLQEDFLLDRSPMYQELEDAVTLLDKIPSIASVRLMPCPGPCTPRSEEAGPCTSKSEDTNDTPWAILGDADNYFFTYQATLWRRENLFAFFTALIETTNGKSTEEKRAAAIMRQNIAENLGKELLKKILPSSIHLAYKRAGPWSNAVYLCPWPYRPTAIVRGRVEPFAEELFRREGLEFSPPASSLL